MAESLLDVSVVYAPRAREVQVAHIQLPIGATVEHALQHSGLLAALSRADLDHLEIGVWGRKVSGSYVLQAHDRVEVYRSLIVDPKVARRVRFAKQGARTAGLFAKRRPGAKPGY